jgi:hypothetical protein
MLRAGFVVIAQKLQEAADMNHSDVRSRLSKAVTDAHAGTGTYANYYIDHTGDGESGDCIYSANGDMKKAPYELSDVGGKATANLDTANSVSVTPMTTYQEEADDDDQYASMMEAKLYTEGPKPLIERFISKAERSGASEDSFAGKGKSFPILKPADVGAAVHAMGRAGSGNYGMAQLKANIIARAKAKGWTSELPKAWRGDSSSSTEGLRSTQPSSEDIARLNVLKESGILTEAQVQSALAVFASGARPASVTFVNRGTSDDSINLFESAATFETIKLTEAKADYEIKLIAPGKGSSAFYPAEVLKRDGPGVFKAGTHVYLNHQTAAEEAQRPEGDVRNLAGVLTTAAVYHENHAKGPGLYGRMKVFQDHAQIVEEKAAHVGMSIRASGVAESGKRQDGLPILKQLTGAESVDVVTRAGAGGMILTEAAKPAKEGEMTLEETQKAIQDGIKAATAPLIERALRGDATVEANAVLEGLSLHADTKARIVKRVTESALPVTEGKLDVTKLRESIVAIAKEEGEYASRISGGGRVFGMGAGGATVTTAEAKKPEEIEGARIKTYMRLGLSEAAAKVAVRGRAA